MLNYAVKMGYIGKNHLTTLGTFRDSMHVRGRADFYTAEEFKIYIEVAREQAEEHQRKHSELSEWEYYTFFGILFYTGLRKGECQGFIIKS